MFRSGIHSFGVGAFFIAGRRVEVAKKNIMKNKLS